MSLFKKIFGQSGSTQPTEPVFPEDSFTLLKLNMSDGLAFAMINKGYVNYSKKSSYPFFVGIELEILDKNENGHPVDTEAVRLNQIEDEIEDFLKQKQIVHFVGRVTRNGARDILIYIDTPKLTQEEIDTFCDSIQKERKIIFSINKDTSWNAVSGFMTQSG